MFPFNKINNDVKFLELMIANQHFEKVIRSIDIFKNTFF